MKCVICKQGDTKAGMATFTLDKDGATLVIRNVPAQICDNCGEEYFDEETTAKVLEQAENLAKNGIQVEIRQYAPEAQ